MKSITRREFLRQSFRSGMALATAGMTTMSCGKKKHPNLLIVFPDQMRGQAMGFLGEEPVITPNLDKFSEESVVFTHAVSNYPVCSPYRAMLMTGQYPHTNGVLANCNSRSARYHNQLRQTARCWSDVLKEMGYSLGYIGKWHLDAPYRPYVDCYNNRGKVAWNEWCPPNRRHGFDFWYAYGTYDQHMKPMYWTTYSRRNKPKWVDQWGPEHEAELATQYIKNIGDYFRQKDRPFALVVAMNPPHMPYDQVPKRYVDMYQRYRIEDLCQRPNIPKAGTKWGDYYRKHIRNYYAMITGVDEQFGRILQALEEEGLEKDTIVLFTSDHGNCLGIHNQISKNNHYEESMRVPFMIRWPGQLKPRQDDLLFSVPDIYPTLLDLMGFKEYIPSEVEGKSFAGVFRTGEGDRPSSQPYLWVPLGQPEFGKRGVRTHRYTLMINYMPDASPEIELYDRETDPYQMNNVAKELPNVVSRLIKEELQSWMRKNKDPWWGNVKPQLESYIT